MFGLIRVGVLPSTYAKEANHKETGGVCQGLTTGFMLGKKRMNSDSAGKRRDFSTSLGALCRQAL